MGVAMTSENRNHIFIISYRRDDTRSTKWPPIRLATDCLRARAHLSRRPQNPHRNVAQQDRQRLGAQQTLRGGHRPPLGQYRKFATPPDQPDDMVCHELISALACDDLLLIPTLVEGAQVPRTAGLPAELRPLFEFLNALRITEEGWEDDTQHLIAEIAEVTSLPLDQDGERLLHNVSTARQRISQLKQTSQFQAEQLDALRRTIDDLTHKLAETSAAERKVLAAAFAALAQGDSRAAEDAFESEYDAQNRAFKWARQKAVETARNVANLALSRRHRQGDLLSQSAQARARSRRNPAPPRRSTHTARRFAGSGKCLFGISPRGHPEPGRRG